jgi:DNA-binding GntR family transcriptional regulator
VSKSATRPAARTPAPAATAPGADARAARDRAASTPEYVARSIVRGILKREYAPGQRLTEAELTLRLQVSRGAIREALRILAGSGVVELTPHRGAVIRMLGPKDSQELIEVMEMLTGLAARLAARNIGVGGNRARFEAVAQTLRAPHSAGELANVLDERLGFYNVMFAIADNRELDRALPMPRAHLFRTQFHRFLTTADLRAMIGEYRGVAEAILAGDEQKAEQRMRRHIQRTGERTIPRLAAFPSSAGARHGG